MRKAIITSLYPSTPSYLCMMAVNFGFAVRQCSAFNSRSLFAACAMATSAFSKALSYNQGNSRFFIHVSPFALHPPRMRQ